MENTEKLLISDFLRFKREVYQQENGLTYPHYQELLEFAIGIYRGVVETGVDSAGNILNAADMCKARELLRRLTFELEISQRGE